MKKSSYTEEQIAFALRPGAPVVDVCRRMGIVNSLAGELLKAIAQSA